MKKKTVITTEKLEVWVIPQPSEVRSSVAQEPETESSEAALGSESLSPLVEEDADKNVPPTFED